MLISLKKSFEFHWEVSRVWLETIRGLSTSVLLASWDVANKQIWRISVNPATHWWYRIRLKMFHYKRKLFQKSNLLSWWVSSMQCFSFCVLKKKRNVLKSEWEWEKYFYDELSEEVEATKWRRWRKMDVKWKKKSLNLFST